MLILSSHDSEYVPTPPYPFVTIFRTIVCQSLPNVHRALLPIQQIKIDISKFLTTLKKILGFTCSIHSRKSYWCTTILPYISVGRASTYTPL